MSLPTKTVPCCIVLVSSKYDPLCFLLLPPSLLSLSVCVCVCVSVCVCLYLCAYVCAQTCKRWSFTCSFSPCFKRRFYPPLQGLARACHCKRFWATPNGVFGVTVAGMHRPTKSLSLWFRPFIQVWRCYWKEAGGFHSGCLLASGNSVCCWKECVYLEAYKILCALLLSNACLSANVSVQ